MGKFSVEIYSLEDGKISETPTAVVSEIRTQVSARKKIRDVAKNSREGAWKKLRFRVLGPGVDSWFTVKMVPANSTMGLELREFAIKPPPKNDIA